MAPPRWKPAWLSPRLQAAVPRGIPPVPKESDPRWQFDKDNLVRILAFYLALGFVFVRFSMIHEILDFRFGIRTYLPWILGAPAFLGTLLSGGVRRSLRHRPTLYWIGFALWLILATPFSFWMGGSFDLLKFFFKSEFPMLFLVAGLPMDWRECRKMFGAIALAAATNVAMGRYFVDPAGIRMSLDFGSIANANDFAAHLVLVLPFLLLIVLEGRGRLLLLRLGSLLLVAYGVYMIVSTGSRGGLVALLAAIAFLLLKFPGRVRLAVAVLVPVAAVVMMSMAPKYAVERLATMFQSESVPDERLSEAVGSSEARIQLLKASALLTMEHPLFGVGPGEFADFRGSEARENGRRGGWQVAHNTYTQVSSEAGIPAFIFFLAAIVSSYRLLSVTYRKARLSDAHRPMAMAALCTMLALVGFCVAIFFLSLAYRFYLPVLSGLAISLASAASREIQLSETAPR